jgi:hypothetical protein
VTKNNSSISTVCAHLSEENSVALHIYELLTEKLNDTQKEFPTHQNIFAIYFMDLLKFFTGIRLAQINLEYHHHSSTPTTKAESPCFAWPYIRTAELKRGFSLSQFSWGHSFKKTIRTHSKSLLNLKNFLIRNEAHVSVSHLAASKEILVELAKNKIRFDIVSMVDFGGLGIPRLKQQINILEKFIEIHSFELCGLIPKEIIIEVLSNHIQKNCYEGVTDHTRIGEILVCSCGVEIENRMLSAIAKQKGSHIINIFHGDSYGVQAKPSFEEGEKLFCDDLIVFGLQGHQKTNLRPHLVRAKPHGGMDIDCKTRVKKPMLTDHFLYVPTAPRSSKKRFGPHEDIALAPYFDIWMFISELFSNQVTFKLHPKSQVNLPVKCKTLRAPFRDCLDKADTFIFDHLSTAFVEAAATTKPIIFFDYKSQNFTKIALKSIKERCVYFNMSQEAPKNLEEIIAIAKRKTFSNSFTRDFSLGLKNPTVEKALVRRILEIKKMPLTRG